MSTVSEVSEESWDAWRDYYRAGRDLIRAFDRRLQDDAGISYPEYLLMLVLLRAPERRLRIGELADELAWEKSRVSHQVTRMSARGLVERRACESDGRGVWVGLTADGSRTLLEATRDHTDAIRSWFFDVINPDELHVLRTLSQRILTTLADADALPRETEANDTDRA